jgi:hypothetical protein
MLYLYRRRGDFLEKSPCEMLFLLALHFVASGRKVSNDIGPATTPGNY